MRVVRGEETVGRAVGGMVEVVVLGGQLLLLFLPG
jgi:hypothetical protein